MRPRPIRLTNADSPAGGSARFALLFVFLGGISKAIAGFRLFRIWFKTRQSIARNRNSSSFSQDYPVYPIYLFCRHIVSFGFLASQSGFCGGPDRQFGGGGLFVISARDIADCATPDVTGKYYSTSRSLGDFGNKEGSHRIKFYLSPTRIDKYKPSAVRIYHGSQGGTGRQRPAAVRVVDRQPAAAALSLQSGSRP